MGGSGGAPAVVELQRTAPVNVHVVVGIGRVGNLSVYLAKGRDLQIDAYAARQQFPHRAIVIGCLPGTRSFSERGAAGERCRES
jgi:hypothetical protein